MGHKKCANRKTAISLLIIAVFLFISSVIIVAVFPIIFQHELREKLPLLKKGLLYPFWRDLPIPITESLYFFNITNSVDFVKGKAKLKVEEVGPYTYDGTFIKENIRWYPNGTMSYKEVRTYQFNTEKSVGSEEDEIFTLNGPMVIAADYVKNEGWFAKFALGVFFAGHGESLVTAKKISELTYNGYEDPIIKGGKWVMPDLPYQNGIFSWLYGKNNTDDGTFTVFSGEDNLAKLNIINNWNGHSKLDFWENTTCNMINGSSAEFSPPLHDEQKDFTFFQSILCRSLTLTYDKVVEHEGIKGRRFVVTNKVFANETVNPDNHCFNTKPDLRSGVQDLSRCQFGAPVILSLPHFYYADPFYSEQISGMLPNSQKHLTYVDVEPITGISLELGIRFQINLELKKIPGLGQFEELKDGVFPVFWVDLKATVNDKLGNFFKKETMLPKYLVYSLSGINILISVILFVVGLAILYRAKQADKVDEDDPILQIRDDKEDKFTAYSENDNTIQKKSSKNHWKKSAPKFTSNEETSGNYTASSDSRRLSDNDDLLLDAKKG